MPAKIIAPFGADHPCRFGSIAGRTGRDRFRSALLSATALAGVLWVPSAWAGCATESIDTAQTQTGGSTVYCSDLYVGDSGTGSLVISSGGTVTDARARIGSEAAAIGTVTVTGAGSRWTNTSDLFVGYAGTGGLTVSSRGTVSSTDGYIGGQAGATGTVTVSGSGTNWNNSGALSVGSSGTGTLTLTDRGIVSVNGGSGTLSIASAAGSAGTLNFGSAAGDAATAPGWLNASKVQFGSGTGKIVFNHTDTDFSFWRTITGAGGVDAHAGTTALTGSHDYSGPTTVYGGSLMVNGTIASTATVKNGGTLGGTGTLGAVVVESGGIFAPGDPVPRGKSGTVTKIATLTMNGDFAVNTGGILEIEVDDAGSADKVAVTGAVDVSGGTLRVVALSGDYEDNRYEHTIIDNDGADAVTGTFGTIDNRLAFYSASVDTAGGDGNDAVLTLARNANDFADVAVTANEKAVATKLSALPGSDGDTIRSNILGLSTDATRNAYQQLSGDIYATNQQVNVQVTQQVHQQVAGRLANLRATAMGTARQGVAQTARQIAGFASAELIASDGRETLAFSSVRTGTGTQADNGLWAQAVGGFGEVDGDENAAAVDYDWRGVLAGYDVALSPDLRLGTFFGFVDGENKQSEVSTHLDTETLMAGIYGEYDLDDWRLSAQASWSRVAARSRRELTFGSVDRTALAEYADNVIALEAELAYGFSPAANLWLEPYGAVVVRQQLLDEFSETGAGSANLTRDGDWDISGSGTVGLRASGLWDSGEGWQLVPQAGLGWKHYVGPTDNGVTLSFSGGDSFGVSGTKIDHDTLVGNLGISRISDSGWRAYADYRPSFSVNQREHSFVTGLRLEW